MIKLSKTYIALYVLFTTLLVVTMMFSAYIIKGVAVP
jgi:hypothetical protein